MRGGDVGQIFCCVCVSWRGAAQYNFTIMRSARLAKCRSAGAGPLTTPMAARRSKRAPWSKDFRGANDREGQHHLVPSASSPRSVGLELGSEGEKRNSKFSESSGSSDSDSESVLFRTIGQRRVRHIPNLRDDELRHPLDRQNTQLISLVPGIEGIVNAMISPMSEEVALLENIGTSVLVSEDQLPDIHALLVDAANLLQVRETRCSIV